MSEANMLERLVIPHGGFCTIVADPPWAQGLTGGWKRRPKRAKTLPYPTMSLEDIKRLPIADLSSVGCHLWLWTTNQFLEQGFEVMKAWGFKYLAPITWVKPSGLGNYFIHRTQTMLFGYRGKCLFKNGRYKPTVLFSSIPPKHSQKPEESYKLIEEVSAPERLELFARRPRDGWAVWGNEV